MFQKMFQLEKEKIKAALKSSVELVTKYMPRNVLEMTAEDFLLRSSEDENFDNRYNLDF